MNLAPNTMTRNCFLCPSRRSIHGWWRSAIHMGLMVFGFSARGCSMAQGLAAMSTQSPKSSLNERLLWQWPLPLEFETVVKIAVLG